jgi:putative DNA methylase
MTIPESGKRSSLMLHPIKSPRKLIEVALPLDAINAACTREKSIRHGHLSTLHLWWARRPLAAARAVIFAQMVNDPGCQQGGGFKYGKNKKEAAEERKRLFKIIEDLVLWENTTNEMVLEQARTEIRRSWREVCELNKDHPQVAELNLGTEWPGARGLAEDVRYYGAWMRQEAQKRIGELYPPVEVTAEMAKGRPDLVALVGKKLTVIAWLWARTVKSPNPVFGHVDVPLVSTFVLSSKVGKEAWVEPVLEGDGYRFEVRVGKWPEGAQEGTKLARGASFRCLMSDIAVDKQYIRNAFVAKLAGQKLMAIVVEGVKGRLYLSPSSLMETIAKSAVPASYPEAEMNQKSKDLVSGRGYGFRFWHEIFTPRQLVALTTFSDLVGEARERVRKDALAGGMVDDGKGIDAGGIGATAYAEAVSVYLAFGLSKMADTQSSLCRWKPSMDQSIATFGRQALPMVWDFSEANSFGRMAGDYITSLSNMMRVIDNLVSGTSGVAHQADAQTQNISFNKIISTDPPYYDNIGYADLSDFFYVWLRCTLRPVFTNLLSTIAVPKAEELVATPYRHGSKEKAESFFLTGMTQAITNLAKQAHPESPITIYYAFKQAERETSGGTYSTGWETFLEAIHRSGLQLSGTWPMRTELGNRMIGSGTNALASSIVLVCRPRPLTAPTTSRRAFLRELNAILPDALDEMTKGANTTHSPVAPVDLSQAIIGPGMAVFSKYSAVLEADGTPMSVRTALQLINRFLAEDDFDPDTQFCLHWFEQHNWNEGLFGEADVLARSKSTSVDTMKQAGVLHSGAGKVRLLKWAEYPADWNPTTDNRTPIWEALHQLIRSLKQNGESHAGSLLANLEDKAEGIRQLAYRLYTLCERLGQAEDARVYNELITSWSGVEAAAVSARPNTSQLPFEF